MLHEAFRHDPRHHLGGRVDTLAPAIAQSEREGVRYLFGLGGREGITSGIPAR
jgi:hypothetical protein